MSSLLVELLDSPDIKKRIQHVFNELCTNRNVDAKKIAMTSAFLCIQNIRTDAALISEIAGNGIYDSSLRANNSFCEFFKFEHDKIKAKSTVFCQSLIRNFFEAEYTINFLLGIAKSFDLKQHRSREYKEIFRSALKFSSIERLLPDKDKILNIEKYYEQLKKKVAWLVHDPHFWVQYAMAKIAVPDFEKAQQLLDNAYGKAKAKGDGYNTSNIDTQQARLYFLKAMKVDSTMSSFQLFHKAHELLRKTPNDIYKFRQLHLYNDYFRLKYDLLDETSKKRFIYSCKEISHIIKNDFPQGAPQSYKALGEIDRIIDSIKILG